MYVVGLIMGGGCTCVLVICVTLVSSLGISASFITSNITLLLYGNPFIYMIVIPYYKS